MPHGPIKASGLIFSDGAHKIAYATDFSKFTDGMVDFFQGVDLFVIDALRRYPHPTHPHVAMTLEGLARVGQPRAILTHMDNTMDYDELAAELPPGVGPRSEEHTSELQSLMRITYAVFCVKKKTETKENMSQKKMIDEQHKN